MFWNIKIQQSQDSTAEPLSGGVRIFHATLMHIKYTTFLLVWPYLESNAVKITGTSLACLNMSTFSL